MKNKVFYLNNEKTALLKAYLLDKVESIPFGNARPAILIFPGGGYTFCSEREAEPIAMRYLAEGYNAFILYYSCNRKFPASATILDFALYSGLYGTSPSRTIILSRNSGTLFPLIVYN